MTEPAWVKALLTLFVLAFLALFLIVPLCAVFAQAFSRRAGDLLSRPCATRTRSAPSN